MNLFSQSKLTLKLKKPNSTSTISTNDCSKPETSDFSKSEQLNNSVVSESNSFVEILNTIQSDDKITSASQDVLKTSSDKNVSNIIIIENKSCPVCLQMIDVKHFISHVKLCGTSHNLSSETLIKAVDLQERQIAEREALGLPKLSKNNDVKKKKCINKQKKLKIGSDSNLDLAIAMSVSLQESKEADILKESETLLEAGLEKEALEKRKTLESFGFKSYLPVKSKFKISKTNSLLFKQTKESREKRITEKVAMILIDSDKSSIEILNDLSNTKLGSKYLNKIRHFEHNLWTKSLLEDDNVCSFYVKNLSKFIKPCQNSNITNLNNILPSTQNTPFQEENIINKEYVNEFLKVKENSSLNNKLITSHKIIENKTMSEYSSRWKSMVGNQSNSDITIFTKDEREIPAHILVFFVQCPDILKDIITEEFNACKSKNMIMWLEYSYEACLAFLEFIYSGQESFISSKYKGEYYNLGKRYNICMTIDNEENCGWVSEENDTISKRKSPEFSIDKVNNCKRYKTSSPDMFLSDDTKTNASYNFLGSTVNDEKSFSEFKTKQWLNSCNKNQDNYNSLFTENLLYDVQPQTVSFEKSPSHSFHSASTVSLQSTPKFNNKYNIYQRFNDNKHNIDQELNDDKHNIDQEFNDDKHNIDQEFNDNESKDISTWLPPESLLTKSKSMINISPINSCKNTELIIINSDSDNESVHMILPEFTRQSNKKKNILSIDLLNENSSSPLLQSNIENKNYTIELSDNSSDSIYSASTTILKKRNHSKKSQQSLFHNISMSSPRNNILMNIDDDRRSVFSAVTNVLPTSNTNAKLIPKKNISVIDLVEDSSDSTSNFGTTSLLKNDSFLESPLNNQYTCKSIPTSLPKSNLFSSLSSSNKNNKCNSSCTNTKITASFNFNSENLNNENQIKSKDNSKSYYQNNLLCSYTIGSIQNNDDSNEHIEQQFSNVDNILNKPHLDSELFENTVMKKSSVSNSHNNGSIIKLNEVNDLISNSSNKSISTNPVSTQVSSIKIPSDIDTFNLSSLNNNDYVQDRSNSEQIVDDPWMDYWMPVDIPQAVSPALSDKNCIIENPEVQTPIKLNVCSVNIDEQIQSNFLNCSNIKNSPKKNAVTPNKFGSRLNTPKTLRRVQSESVIGFKDQVTPLPDYSSMKTPDLRKEFDRYGLKDLGRRKGKLILRHIYDVLHPLSTSEEIISNLEAEHFSDSSDDSENGIPDNIEDDFNELETFSQTKLSNRISIEMGFKQLLENNENLHKKILCYEPIWIEDLKEYLKQQNVNISMQKLMIFLDDKCVTFRSKSLNDQRQKTLAKKNVKRKKLF